MPKRTRREKVLAKERRLKLLQESQTYVSESAPVKQITQTEIKTVDKTSHPSTAGDKVRTYFISDFKRSLFFISIIIALEIAVYFGTIY